MMKRLATTMALATAGLVSLGGMAMAAEEVTGKPIPGGTGFQRPVTPVMHDLVWLDDFLLVIITAIVLFVTALMGWCIFRYNAKRNPKPATFTHNALVEVIWTAVPVLILVVIAIPSLRLLFDQLVVPEPDLTIKATGNQWYWSYEYPVEEIEFDAYMIGSAATTPPEGTFPEDYEPTYNWTKNEDTLKTLEAYGYAPDEFLLAADEAVVVPVNKNVHVLVTGSDVIHAWAIPAFGVKIDTIPGRVNETWFRAEETGTYFGQCSELCGLQHAYMPIVVKVVEQAEYDAWVNDMVAKRDGVPTSQLASAGE
ncbi:cytochrome c oxidase subunit II [Rhodobacteraceae bacterium NNCM2]|nr:cytochrome c oxidase subunit II [Coraliihabitans acroporae]